MSQKPQPDSRERLADRMEQELPSPKLCLKHPAAVYFDGKNCDACLAEAEFLKLTDSKF